MLGRAQPVVAVLLRKRPHDRLPQLSHLRPGVARRVATRQRARSADRDGLSAPRSPRGLAAAGGNGRALLPLRRGRGILRPRLEARIQAGDRAGCGDPARRGGLDRIQRPQDGDGHGGQGDLSVGGLAAAAGRARHPAAAGRLGRAGPARDRHRLAPTHLAGRLGTARCVATRIPACRAHPVRADPAPRISAPLGASTDGGAGRTRVPHPARQPLQPRPLSGHAAPRREGGRPELLAHDLPSDRRRAPALARPVIPHGTAPSDSHHAPHPLLWHPRTLPPARDGHGVDGAQRVLARGALVPPHPRRPRTGC